MTNHACRPHSPPHAIKVCNHSVQWRFLASLLLVIAALTFAGCRNCRQPLAPQQYTPYNAPTYNPAQYNVPQGYAPQNFGAGGSGFNTSANTRIPSPSTYSLNIPGGNNSNATANAANAYGYRVGQLPNGLLNTGQSAPTPASQPGSYNQQQGWRRSDGGDLNTSSTVGQSVGNSLASAATSVLDSSSRADSGGAAASVPTLRTASSTSATGSGLSVTQSNDYRTTETDERLDNSRLLLTDATNVRTTAPLVQNQGSGQYVAPYYEPRQTQLASNQQVISSQGSFNRAYQPYSQTQSYQGSFAQPQSQAQVLAQSTARYDPYSATANTASGDWRDRGRETNSF